MPYIKDKEDRKILDAYVEEFIEMLIVPGYLNYFLYKLAKRTCKNYKSWRNFIGELEACKLEIYRRQTAPYEDIKIEENGDVE